MRKTAFILAVLMSTVGFADTGANIERLPIEALYKVTEPDGSVKYLSEDRRFVFVGKMYDLWKGEAMTAGVEITQKINWNRNGVTLEKISFPLGNETGSRSLVIAPECEDCRALLELAISSGARDMNIVLLASSEAGRRDNALVWCSTNRVEGLKTVYLDREQPPRKEINPHCDRLGLMLAEQAAMVFGIGQLPMFIDAEGNGYVGEKAIYAVSQ